MLKKKSTAVDECEYDRLFKSGYVLQWDGKSWKTKVYASISPNYVLFFKDRDAMEERQLLQVWPLATFYVNGVMNLDPFKQGAGDPGASDRELGGRKHFIELVREGEESLYFAPSDVASATRPGTFIPPHIELNKWREQLEFVTANQKILSPAVSPRTSPAASPRDGEDGSESRVGRKLSSPSVLSSAGSAPKSPRGLSLVLKGRSVTTLKGSSSGASSPRGEGTESSSSPRVLSLFGKKSPRMASSQDLTRSHSNPNVATRFQPLETNPNDVPKQHLQPSEHRHMLGVVEMLLVDLEQVVNSQAVDQSFLQLLEITRQLRTIDAVKSDDPGCLEKAAHLNAHREDLAALVSEKLSGGREQLTSSSKQSKSPRHNLSWKSSRQSNPPVLPLEFSLGSRRKDSDHGGAGGSRVTSEAVLADETLFSEEGRGEESEQDSPQNVNDHEDATTTAIETQTWQAPAIRVRPAAGSISVVNEEEEPTCCLQCGEFVPPMSSCLRCSGQRRFGGLAPAPRKPLPIPPTRGEKIK